jgi:PAS domain S-box-containing protein
MPVVAVGDHRRVVFWNAASARVTGYSRAEAFADPDFLRRLYPLPGQLERLEHTQRQHGDVAAALLQAGPAETLRARDGSRRTVVWTVLAGGIDAPPVWYLGHDLTQALAGAQELRHIEARYRQLVEHGRDLIALHDPDGRFVYVSPAAQAILGYRPEELVGADPYDFYHPDDVERIQREAHRQALAGRPAATVRYRFRRKDRRYAWLESLAVPLFEDAAEPQKVTALLTSSRDVSAAVEAEQQLAASEARLRLALRFGGIGVYEVDLQPQVMLHFSDEYLRLLGYGPADRELFARGFEPLFHPDDAPRISRQRHELERGERRQFELDCRRMHRDGRYVWFRNAGQVVDADVRGRPRRVIGTVQDIDARKRAEQEALEAAHRLARSEERLRLAMRSTGIGVFEFFPQRCGGHHFSDACFTVLGYGPEDRALFESGWEPLFHPDDRARMVALRDAMQAGRRTTYDAEFRRMHRDGSWRWLRSVARVVETDAEGRALRIVGMREDISERKRAEQTLQEATARLAASEQRLRMALEATGAAEFEVFPQQPWGHYLSDEFLRLLGYGPEDRELFERGWEPLFHPDDAPMIARNRIALARGELPTFDLECRRLLRDGRWRWMRNVGRVVEADAEGRPLRVIGTVQDIDERKRAEQALHEANARLARAQQIARVGDFHHVFGQWPPVWSEQTFRILGYAPGEVTPSRGAFLDRLLPAERETTREALESAWAQAIDYGFDAHVVWPDGTVRSVHHTGQPLRDGRGRLIGYAGTIQDITDRKAVEDALREATNELEQAQRRARIGSWRRSFADGSVQWSATMYEIAGRDPSKQPPSLDEMRALCTAEGWVRWQDAARNALASGQPYTLEYEIVRPDGEHRWLLAHAEFRRDAEGRITEAVGTSQDITERKQAELALRAATAELERAQRQARLGNWRWSPATDQGQWSPVMLEIFGLDPAGPAPGLATVERLLAPDSAERMKQALERVIATGEPYELDLEVVRPDGSRRWIHARGDVERDAAGRVAFLVGASQDVTESRRVEAALRAATAELEHAQRIARLGSWSWAIGDAAAQWSPTMLEIYGRAPTDPAPTYAEMAHLLTPESHQRLTAAVGRAVETGAPYTVELEVVRPDGTRRWVVGHGVAERDAAGRPVRLVGTGLDITERKRVELALADARDEVRAIAGHFEDQLDDERKRIAMDVHDEVGQLLTAMKHEIHLLRTRSAEPGAAGDRLDRLSELVDNSIEVTRNVALNLRPPALDLGLAPALEWLAEDFELRSEIGCEVRLHGAEVRLDDRQATALFRIAQESLTNVARHSRATRVRIDLAGAPERLSMTICDDGCGFDLERARAQGHFGLLGMNERAWRIGATLTIDTRPGQGTCVRVELQPTDGGHP